MKNTDVIKLLAIDDNPDNLTTLRAMVRESFPQAILLTAANDPIGIAVAVNEEPDVILLDLAMPGMSGIALCRRFKTDKRTNDIPVVCLMTPATDTDLKVAALAVGAEGFLTRPLEPVEFSALIKTMTRIRRANRSQRTERDSLEELVAQRTHELANEAARRLLLMEQSRDGIVILDQDGQVYEANRTFAEMLDYPYESMARLNVRDWESLHSPEQLMEMIRKVDEKGNLFETRHRRRDGTLFDVEISTNATWFAGEKLILCVCRDISKRRQMEEALRESEERFKALHNASFGGIAIHDQGLILDCNQGLSEISGFTHDELISMDGLLLIAEPSRAEVKANIRCGYDKPYEVMGLRKNGEEYPLRIEGRNIPYSGKLVSVVEFRDITERWQKQQQLKTSEEKHRRLFETMAQGVLYQGADGGIVSANPAAEKILGLTFEQMQGKTSMDPRWQMIEEDGTPVAGEVHPAMIALRTGRIVGPTIKGVFHPGKNKHVWLNITAIPLFQPEKVVPYQVYATFEDITERKEAQDALQESLDRIEAIYAALDDAIILVNPETRKIIECNSSTADMFGYSYDEIIGQDTRFMHVDQEHFEQFGREAIAAYVDPGYYMTEFEMRRKDGTVFPTESFVRPVEDSSGRIVYVVSVVRDITERKQVQSALQQKNQELEHFIYSVSHDLKSPLVTVRSFVGALRQDLQSGDQQLINEDLNYIDKASGKMQQMLEALLQYSRIGRKDALPQTQLVSQLVADCLAELAGILKQKKVQVVINDMPYQLHGDPLHFSQIWQNLVENAVKYMVDSSHPRIEIGVTQRAQELVFYVSDNGMGVQPENGERIFNLFSQLNPHSDGSGLGLALVKKIVTIYQGRIWVESAGERQGSCFMFTLPGAVLKQDQV